MFNILYSQVEKWRKRKILSLYNQGVFVRDIARIMNMKEYDIKAIINYSKREKK